jgi:hypothetical protein
MLLPGSNACASRGMARETSKAVISHGLFEPFFPLYACGRANRVVIESNAVKTLMDWSTALIYRQTLKRL